MGLSDKRVCGVTYVIHRKAFMTIQMTFEKSFRLELSVSGVQIPFSSHDAGR